MTAAVERLADLAAQDGEQRAARRAETPQGGDRARRERYRRLINQPDLAPHAAELARAAEAIGRSVRRQGLVEAGGPAGSGRRAEAAAALARLAKAEPPPADGPDARRPPRAVACAGRSSKDRGPRRSRASPRSPTTPSNGASPSPSTTGAATSASFPRP